jgi:hypothetical protein
LQCERKSYKKRQTKMLNWSFLTQVMFYTFIMLVSQSRHVIVNTADIQTLGIHLRTLISVLQVLSISIIYFFYLFVWYVVKVVKKDRLIFTRLDSDFPALSVRKKSNSSWLGSSASARLNNMKDTDSVFSRTNSVKKSTSCQEQMSFSDAKQEQAQAHMFVITVDDEIVHHSQQDLLLQNDSQNNEQIDECGQACDKSQKSAKQARSQKQYHQKLPQESNESNVIYDEQIENKNDVVKRIETWNNAQKNFTSDDNVTENKTNDIEMIRQQEHFANHEIGSLMDNISDNASELGTVQLAIVFENNHHLDLYCFYVHWIGLMLWTTFASWNWQSQNTNTVFILGLYVGWLLNVCMQYFSGQLIFRYVNPFVDLYKTIVGEPKSRLQKNAFVQALFALNCLTILVVSFLRCSWPHQENDTNNTHLVLTMYVPAFVCGMYWISLASEMAFRGHSQCQGIYFDSMRAIPTFLLVTVVTGLYSSADTRLEVFTYIQALSRFACVHLLIVQPILKACMLYIFIIQLEKRKSLDAVLAVCSVLGFMFIFKTDQFGFEYVFALISTCFLIVARCFRDQKLT